MGTFADLLESTVTVEMDLHRSYAEEFGIGEAELETTTPSPTTRAYTDFLVRTAALGTFGDTVAPPPAVHGDLNETGTRLALRAASRTTSGTPRGSTCTRARSSRNSRTGARD